MGVVNEDMKLVGLSEDAEDEIAEQQKNSRRQDM